MFTDRHKMAAYAVVAVIGVLGLHELAKKLDI